MLLRHAVGQDIGKCNLTTFTKGGQQCQRTLISNLKNNASLNCRFGGLIIASAKMASLLLSISMCLPLQVISFMVMEFGSCKIKLDQKKTENVIGKAWHYQKLKTFIDLIPLFDVFACYACFLGSFEYEKQSICLNGHVSSCVDGVPLLNAFKGEIVKLLELLVYHCGRLSFEVSRINPLILGQVDCDAGKLEGMVGCWDDFRTTFNASRNDSSLCR